MTTPILKRLPLFGSEESKSAGMSRTKKKSVTVVIPEGEFGGRGNTQFKKTPSRVTHTGINAKKRGKQSSITLQRKCVWYNAQHEAEKRGINLEHPPEEWQNLFDTIKNQLEKPDNGERLIDDDGKLIWNIPSFPGDCTVEKKNLAIQNVAEKINLNKIATEKRLLPNQSPVRSHWTNRKLSGVTRGIMAILSVRRQCKENKQKPTRAIAAGPPPILTSSPDPSRVRTIKKQHEVIRDITPYFSRTKNSMKNRSCTAPRLSYRDISYSSGAKRKRIQRRKSMSARAQRIMSAIRKGEEQTCKKRKLSSPFLQLTKDFGSILKTTPSSSPCKTTTKRDVFFRKDSFLRRPGSLKEPIICGAMKSKSPSLTPRLEPQRTMSPAARNGSTDEPQSLTSPVNIRFPSPRLKATIEAKVRQTPTGDGNNDGARIPSFSLLKYMEQQDQSSEELRIAWPLNSSAKEIKATDTLTSSKMVAAPVEKNVISGLSTPLPKVSSVCPTPEKSWKRKQLNQQEQSKSKRRRLENEAVNIPSNDLNSTEAPEVLTPKSRTGEKSRVSKNTVVSPLNIPATPDFSKPSKKKLSPGLISVSPSHKRNNCNYTGSKDSKTRIISTDKKKEPSSILKDYTLATPQRFVLQENKEESPTLKIAVGGGTRLIQSVSSKDLRRKITMKKTALQKKRQIHSAKLAAKIRVSVGIDTVNETDMSEKKAAPSLVRLKEQFNILEQDVNQMAVQHRLRFSAVFKKMLKLETMVEVLCQHTKGPKMVQSLSDKTDAPVKKRRLS